MQFIGTANDTLSIAKPGETNSILLNNAVFFFNKGYYEIITSAGNVKLAVLRKVNYEPIKIGALGVPSHSGTGIQSYSSLVTTVGQRQLVVNEDIEITKETAYFLINCNNTEMIKANKSGFLKLFPHSNQPLQTYFRQNKIDF